MNRRDEILHATLALIPQHGLTGLRISHIAKQAKCSPGIIYHYFASKDEIILSLGALVMTEFGQALNTDYLLTLPTFDRLKQAWLNIFHYFASHPDKTLFFEQFKNSPYHTEESLGPDFDKLIGALNEDIANGRLRNFPIPVIYQMTITIAISLAKQVIQKQLDMDAELLDQVATASCQALLSN